jgi:hypothetical protein
MLACPDVDERICPLQGSQSGPSRQGQSCGAGTGAGPGRAGDQVGPDFESDHVPRRDRPESGLSQLGPVSPVLPTVTEYCAVGMVAGEFTTGEEGQAGEEEGKKDRRCGLGVKPLAEEHFGTPTGKGKH